jgi:hypothetical protein
MPDRFRGNRLDSGVVDFGRLFVVGLGTHAALLAFRRNRSLICAI